MKKIIILCLFIFSCNSFDKTKTLNISFESVEGLDENSLVTSKGVKIGSIEAMSLYKNQVIVKVKIDNDIPIPAKSRFVIKDRGILGRCIDIEFNEVDTINLTDQDTVSGQIEKRDDIFKKIRNQADSLQGKAEHL